MLRIGSLLKRGSSPLADRTSVKDCQDGVRRDTARPAHQGRLALDRGYGRFEWSVLDWNELAINTYRKAGAVPMADWTVYRLSGAALRRLAADGDRDG